MNVDVYGGQYGVDATESMNAPTLAAFRFHSPRKAAVLYAGLEAMSIVGTEMSFADSPSAMALLVLDSLAARFGQVSIVDSVIDYGAAAVAGPAAVILTSRSLYLNNVYFRTSGAASLVHVPSANYTLAGPAASPSAWSYVGEVAVGVPIATASCAGGAPMPTVVNGQRLPWGAYTHNVAIGTASAPAPAVTAQHAWDEAAWPVALDASPFHFNVRFFGATGDGETDDTAAIQRALDKADSVAGGVVVLPKGFYRLSATLQVRTPLIGVARHLSVLMSASDGINGATDAAPAPLVHVIDVPGVPALLTMLTIVTWEHLASVYAMQWDSHEHESAYRQCYFYRITECLYGFPHPLPKPVPSPTIPCKPAATLAHALNVITGIHRITGSGRMWNFENEDFLYEGPAYRHMLVVNSASDMLRFYQLNLEHAGSEANCELRGAHNVHIYSFKSEGYWPNCLDQRIPNPSVVLWISEDSSQIRMYSYGGNAKPMSTGTTYPPGFAQFPPSLFRVSGTSTNITLTALVDQFQYPPDNTWNMIADATFGDAANTFLSAHCDRPVLYKRCRGHWHANFLNRDTPEC